MNNPERNHVIKLIFDIFKVSMSNVIFLILGLIFLSNKLGNVTAVIIIAAVFVTLVGIITANWYNTVFLLTDGSIFIRRGWLSKERLEIPFHTINTVDVSSKFIYRIFSIAELKIDTGAAKLSGAELTIVVKEKRAREIRNIITGEVKKETVEDSRGYKFSTRDMFIYSITTSAIFKGFAMMFIFNNIIFQLVAKMLNINEAKINKFIESQAAAQLLFLILVGIFLMLCFSITYTCIRYYDFKVINKGNKLDITYGLFSRKHYSFDINKIKGVYIKTNIIMRFFRICTIEIESIGYGDEEKEKAILIPVCREREKFNVLNQVIEGFDYKGEINRAPKRAYITFFYFKLLLVLIAAAFSRLNLYITVVVFVVLFIVGHLQYKNSAIGVHDDLITMSSGIFTKRQSVMRMSTVQSIKAAQTYFQKRKGLCKYIMNIHGKNFGSTIKVRGMEDRLMEELDEWIY